MSYCELLGFTSDNQMISIQEYRNAHGWAGYIWTALFDKYLKNPDIPYDNWMTRSQDLWTLIKDPRLSTAEKITLWSTFDYSALKLQDIPTLIKAYNKFTTLFPNYQNFVCHIPSMIQNLQKTFDDPDNISIIAWYGMSVSQNLWETTTYDEKLEDFVPYDFSTETKHNFLADVLEELL